jgi:hypothetical protein
MINVPSRTTLRLAFAPPKPDHLFLVFFPTLLPAFRSRTESSVASGWKPRLSIF